MHSLLTRIIAFATLLGLSTQSFAQGSGLDETINRIFEPIANPIVNVIFYSVPIAGVQFPLIVGWLVICGLVATLFFKFIQFRGFKHAIDLVRGRYSKPGDAGEVSHFQALTTALSGTVGLGNIAGCCRSLYRWRGRNVLDDSRWSAGYGIQVHRVYSRSEIP